MKALILAAGLAATPLLASQALAQSDCGGIDRPVVFAGLDWDSNSFQNGVAGFILEHGYGCEVDEIPGSTIPLLNGMIRGDIDITMEMWIPNVREAWDKAEADGDIAAVGVSYPDAKQAWYVPKYMVEGDDAVAPDLKSVEQLGSYKQLFEDPEEPEKGRFLNCVIGWQCEIVNSKKLIAYGLDEDYSNIRPGAGAALEAAVEAAYLRERPVLFYHWVPTWLIGKYDFVMLEEPAYDKAVWDAMMAEERPTEATAYPQTKVVIGANTEFTEKSEEITEFFMQYSTTSAETSAALAYMHDNDAEADEAALEFLRTKPDVWTKWVPADVAERVSAAVAK